MNEITDLTVSKVFSLHSLQKSCSLFQELFNKYKGLKSPVAGWTIARAINTGAFLKLFINISNC